MSEFESALKRYQEAIYANDKMPDGWKIHVTPTITYFYKDSWANLDSRKYIIPSFYLRINTQALFEEKNTVWKFQIDHYNENREQSLQYKVYEKIRKEKEEEGNRENHGRTLSFPNSLSINVASFPRDSKEERTEYYKEIVESSTIKEIDIILNNIDSLINTES